MGLRYKFEEYTAIDRDVATGCGADAGPDRAKGDEILGPSHGAPEDAADEECGVEGGLAADKVGRGAPERGAKDQPDIVGDGAEAEIRYGGKLIRNGRADGCDPLRPEIVHQPAEATDDEKHPLESSASDNAKSAIP